jgi:hypothetical protein
VSTGDSLVLAGVELLAGGVPSDHPLCAGAIFQLAKGFDFGAPATSFSDAINLILAGDVPTGGRVGNRTPRLPVIIRVPATGDEQADRATLAGAREMFLQAIAADEWDLVWTRSGGLPFTLPCFSAQAVTVDWDLLRDAGLQCNLEVSFQALPYGRSDSPETITFKLPAPAAWTPPPDPVQVDDFGTSGANFLSGDDKGFDASIGHWVSVNNTNLARVTSPTRTAPGALSMSSQAAGDMRVAHCSLASAGTSGLPVKPGDVVSGRVWGVQPALGTTLRSFRAEIEWVDAANAAISAVNGSNTAEVASTWTGTSVVSGTAPANAVRARLRLAVLAAAGAAEVHYGDDTALYYPPVTSAVDWASWSQSTQRVNNSYSARWSQRAHASAVYDCTLPANLDITGQSKLSLWLGLGSSNPHVFAHHPVVTVKIDLYDQDGIKITTVITAKVKVSGLPSSPHWTKVSGYIPQSSSFDYTNLDRYVITVWNHTESGGARVLQADCYLNDLDATPRSVSPASPVRGTVYDLPGGVGTAPAPIAVNAQPSPSAAPVVTTLSAVGDNPWTATGVTLIQLLEYWAAGGGGEGARGTNGGTGAGGGEYSARRNVAVTSGNTYHIQIGGAGSAGPANGPGTSGGDTYGDSTLGGRAHGGQGGGVRGLGLPGLGGSGSTDDIHHSGGDGAKLWADYNDHGQGGGGSGGPAQDGIDAKSSSEGLAAAAVNGGGPGGQGGHHSPETGQVHTGYQPAVGPGGGGGGGAYGDDSVRYAGGAGRNGQARLTYSATLGQPFKTCILHHIPPSAPHSLAPIVPTGALNANTAFPMTGQLQARYEGTFRVLLACTWNTPANSRDVTVTIRQKQTGLADRNTVLTQAGIVPNTALDPAGGPVANGLLDMGAVQLPLSPIAPGNNSDWFQVQVGSTNGSDVPLDLLLLDTTAQTLIYSLPSGATAWVNNLWLDVPPLGRDLGGVYGSQTDRDQAVSILGECDYSGGPLWIGQGHHRLAVYAVQSIPVIEVSYLPFWRLDRLV